MKRSGKDWSVMMSWEQGSETLELLVAGGLTEVQAIDLMIEKEKEDANLGRSFSCLQGAV